MDLIRLMRASASVPLRAVETGVHAAASIAGVGIELATMPMRAAARLPGGQVMGAVADVASEFLGGRRPRRCWAGETSCWIEVRGLTDNDDRLGPIVVQKLQALPHVQWVKLNYPLSRVVVRTEEAAESLSDLCDVVAAAEEQAAEDANEMPRLADLPVDAIVLAASVAAAATSAVGLSVTLAGRLLLLPRLPAGLTAAVTLVDYQPRLRRLVEDRLGPEAADAALAFAASVTYTLTQAPASLAVDLYMHLARAAETHAAAVAWERSEQELAERAECLDGIEASARPRPLPPGPVERHADRSGIAQGLGAATIGIATASLDAAGIAAVVAAPKASRTSREAFAATLGRGLADRHGVLPLKPAALRRLDRVNTVVIDPRALCNDELRVGRIRNVADKNRAAAWQWAQHEIDCGAIGPGWHKVPANGQRAVGEVLVRNANHPLAPAMLREARRGGSEVTSLDTDSLDELRSAFDALHPLEGDVDENLAGLVNRMQQDGRTVAVVSRAAAQAVADADVGICIGAGPAAWHAHLIADDLEGVWRIMHALSAARRASERGVEIAVGASLLGALLMIPGVRGRGPGPVTAGAGAGAWTGYSLARGVLKTASPPEETTRDWHALSAEQVRRLLPTPPPPMRTDSKSRPSPSASAAATSIALPVMETLQRNVFEFATAVRDALSDPLTPVLAVGSAASAVLGSPVDAVLVGSVLAGNAALAATQKLRAERLLRRLLAVQDPPARRVIGGHHYETVDAGKLRPGDVIEVRPGEVVPADARLVEAVDLEVDESSLTGESLPVAKQVGATPAVPVAERACVVHGSTTVVAGTAVGIVIAVGAQTQARRAMQGPGSRGSSVGLQSQLRDLTDRAWPVSLAGGGLVTMLGLVRGGGLRQAVSSGVAVSVAAVPEGLPLVATLAQQASARRLTRSGVLVRSPRSVEALGRVDVVCFDKTGTLSENRLRVTRVEPAAGVSYEDVLIHAHRATPQTNGERHEHATDVAVVEAAEQLEDSSIVAEAHLPFRSGRPFSASIHGRELSIKGAPEVVLPACVDGGPRVQRRVQKMAADGLRVLTVGRRVLSEKQAADARADTDVFSELSTEGLQFTGLLGLSDTPRPDAAGVLKGLVDAEIGVRLITGDHPVTATAIAAELGMPVSEDQVISGSQWEGLARREQEQAVQHCVVFARMSPEHKVQIVETLERMGRVCAMVGDGANDAAAIRAATVGIGVAARGSDPARTAADVMLLDGRIRSLLDALEEGSRLWRRVQAAVAVLLGGNAGEVAFAILGTGLTGRSPLNTRQLLLMNMLTDALPAAALAVSQPSEPSNGHRGPDEAELWRTVAVRGATTAGAATTAWALARVTGTRRRASTVALVALVSTQLGQTLIDSRSPLVVATAAGSLVVLGGVISTPLVSQLLGSTPLGPVGWAQALGTAAAATSVAAVAPKLFGSSDQSSMSTTPTRQSTAYNSRNGVVSTPVTTSVNGSVPMDTERTATPATVGKSGIQTSNSP